VKIELVMYLYQCERLHWHTCKFMFTITGTRIPVTCTPVNVNAARLSVTSMLASDTQYYFIIQSKLPLDRLPQLTQARVISIISHLSVFSIIYILLSIDQ